VSLRPGGPALSGGNGGALRRVKDGGAAAP
jgi:hypothetical protein